MAALAALLLLTNCYLEHEPMPPAVEQIVRPLGLITQPNKLGVYPAGALSQAMGAVIRSPGLLTRAPQFALYNATPFTHAEPMVPHLLGASDSKMFHISRSNADAHWELSFFDGASTFGNDLNGAGLPYQPITFDQTARINWTRQRDRLLFNSDDGILIVDSVNPTTNALALPRMAGLPAPTVNWAGITTGNPGALAANTFTAIRATVKRVYSDGYEVVSAPSASMVGTVAAISDLNITVRWSSNHQYAAGDIVEIYRTLAVPTATATTSGAVFYKTLTYVLTPADIASPGATIRDPSPLPPLGVELYTNPGQTGDVSAKFTPPYATCMGTFKGYTFYGNRTDAAQIKLSVPGRFGSTTTPYERVTMIGARSFTATFTNTTNTLTAISAADMVGLAVGQIVYAEGALVGGFGTITAVGAAQVTVNTTANATITKVTQCGDVMELGGVVVLIQNWTTFISFLAAASNSMDYSITSGALTNPAGFPGVASPDEFAIRRSRYGAGSFTIRASNGQNYVPALNSMSVAAATISPTLVPNGIAWSELGQPEACPAPNISTVGSGTIYGMWPTRDALWIFASDGLWRLTGTGGSAGRGFDWRIDPVDSTLSLSSPQAACVLRDTVYAYTNRGLVAIDGGGIDDTLSTGVIGDLLPGPPFSLTLQIKIAANETDDEIWLGIGSGMTYYIYNTLTKAWTNSKGGNDFANDKVIAYARFLERMASMDQTDAFAHSTTLFGSPGTVDYQPITNGDAFTLKQWIDAVIVCAAADATKSVTPRFNGTAYTARTLTSQNQDARTSWAIPRNAPAVANSLAPGFSVSGTTALTLYGFALRANALTNQRKQR